MSFPVYVAPQAHGVYCEIINGKPQHHGRFDFIGNIVAALTGLPPMIGYIVVGDPMDKDNASQEAVWQNSGGIPEFTFYAHDCATAAGLRFEERKSLVASYANGCGKWVQPVAWTLIQAQKTLDIYEKAMLELGYAAILKRLPNER